MKLRASLLTMLLGLMLTPAAMAGGIMYFRYYDDRHQVHIDQQITDQALDTGYDELDRNLILIRKVPPRLTGKDLERLEAERRKHAEAEEQAKHDILLRQLYSSPKDAERERDRQLDAIQLRIDYNRNSINRLRSLRASEATQAAGFERNGRPVPKDVAETISKYDKQLLDAENDLKAQQAAQTNTRAQFEPTIRRLEEMEAAHQGGVSAPTTGTEAQSSP